MLVRVYKKASIEGWSLAHDADFELVYEKLQVPFSDDNLISDWAKDSVYFMASNSIIEAYSENRFIPKSLTGDDDKSDYINMNYERTLLAAVRMYKFYNNMLIAIRSEAFPDEQVYTVSSGDTLAKIAEKFYGYGNYDLYTLIKERNGLTSDEIRIGQELIIPAIPAIPAP